MVFLSFTPVTSHFCCRQLYLYYVHLLRFCQIFWWAALYRGFNANVGGPEGGLEVAVSDGVREEEGQEGAGQRQQDPGWPTYIVQGLKTEICSWDPRK